MLHQFVSILDLTWLFSKYYYHGSGYSMNLGVELRTLVLADIGGQANWASLAPLIIIDDSWVVSIEQSIIYKWSFKK